MGYLVTVDPATGSGSSFPAFALWNMSMTPPALVDAGLLRIKGATHWQRCRYISSILPVTLIDSLGGSPEALDQIHMFVVEGLAPVMGQSSGGKHFGISNKSVVHLHHAVAALCTSYSWPYIEELPVATWKSFLTHMELKDEYVKSDLNDAIILGITWLCLLGLAPPMMPAEVLRALFPRKKEAALNRVLWDKWHKHIKSSRANSKKARLKK